MHERDFHRVLHRPGTIIDAGAHNGVFTHPFAALPNSRVIAFEPLPSAFARLRASFGDAVPSHVTLRQEALSDRDGEALLAVPVVSGMPTEEWASVAKRYDALGDARVVEERHTVSRRRLDTLGLADVTAMKIDVEGGEYELLRGARETLLRCRPVLSVEIEERHRRGAADAVPAFLDALGFDCFWELGGLWHPIPEFDAATMQRGGTTPADYEVIDPYVFTFYFLPRESSAGMLARLRAAEHASA